ncbi:MAG: hypothetical protein ACLFQ9_00770 [Desulfobacterales bacterium]
MRDVPWIFVLLFLAFSACAGSPDRPPGAVSELEEADASRLKQIAEEKNESITPYKGIGEIFIDGPNGVVEGRAAWIAAADGRFRVEALNVTGQPLARMICSRTECFFIFTEEDCLRRETAGHTGLGPLSGIGLKAREMVLLMGGGVGLRDHDSKEAYATASGGQVLVLKKGFLGTVQTVRFSEDLENIVSTEVFGWRGPVYRAEVTRQERAGRDMMPFGLDITDETGNRITVSVQRCWTDIEPGPDAFATQLPDGAGCDRQ